MYYIPGKLIRGPWLKSVLNDLAQSLQTAARAALRANC